MLLGVVVPEGPGRAEYERAASTILCDCGCNPQSVKECACGRAEEMRVALANDVRSGKNADQIIAAYVAKYGQKILVAPPASGFNLVAWVGPAIGLVAAAIVVAFVIRRWRRAETSPGTGSPPPPAADDPYLARLRKEVEDQE